METLSPFRLAPYFRTRPWGFHNLAPWFAYKTEGEPIGEVWLTGEMCLAETGPLKGCSLQDIARHHGSALLGSNRAGQDFPLLVKILFPKEKLSVQVHPDDALAQHYGELRGKTECWYALEAEPGASVALGLRPGVSKEQVDKAIADHTLESLLEMLPVHKGDMIFVDAGTVHAVGPGLVLLETQQTSDLTYRIYDYGSARELHLDKAMAAMRLKTRSGRVAPKTAGDQTLLIAEQYFTLEKCSLDPGKPQEMPEPGRVEMHFVLDGQLRIEGEGFETFTAFRNQLVVVPAATPAWRIEAEEPAAIVRILPQGD